MELASNLLRFSQEVWLVESTGVATRRYESLRAVSLWITRCHIQDCTDWRGWSWKQDCTDATHPAPFYSFHSFHVWLWRIGGNLVAGIGGKRRLEYIGILCRFCKNAGLKSLKMSRTWVCPGALPRNVSTSIRQSAAWCARCLPRCLSCRSPLCSRTLAFEFRWRTLGEASCFHDLGETFWR